MSVTGLVSVASLVFLCPKPRKGLCAQYARRQFHMNTSHAAQGQKVASREKEQARGGVIPGGIEKSAEGRPQSEKMHALEFLFGTTASVLCGEYDIPGLHLENATILDIGANVGAFAIWALFRWPGCKVISYEPCANTFEELKQAMEGQTRVQLVNAAVTERENPFLRYGVNSNQENSINDLGCQKVEGERVKAVKPFDLPEADFIKIDTEGCEVEILRAYLNKHKPKGVAMEWHSREDRLALGLLLRSKGYYVTESPNVPVCINKSVYIGIMKGALL